MMVVCICVLMGGAGSRIIFSVLVVLHFLEGIKCFFLYQGFLKIVKARSL